ncbi:MAG: MFS transporter [Alphaproteobacteria bacterium]|jgi:MFS family permease|nr:MFS transporter [Alphaproteobacteria bacterium]MBU0802656.1 MFS transporter [Alphaproteobacteria bacterium]MBU0871453.1 MFS transporter [Alphaproteobacteria bacterium]MBU1400120.1 MFS transporter [Alphaproteobacteria bacterium]MBU1591240.1 MFS transporter [Alphaproteobacteria bacterium]
MQSDSASTTETLRWLPITAAVSSISVVGIAIGLGTPLLSIILETRGYSASMIGLNTAIAGFATIAAAPLSTPLATRFGVVWTMLAMIFIGALSIIGFYFATAFWMWFPLRAILHVALTVLFILSEFWISTSAPPSKRGFVLGIYATVLSLGFAGGPWLFAQIGSQGFLPFGVTFALVIVAAIPVLAAWRESPTITPRREGSVSFLRYIWLVPTATAAVLVFGAVETGGFALFPVYGARIHYSEADAALLLSMIGLGNVLLQIPLGMLSDRISDRRHLLLACAIVGLVGTVLMPWLAFDWHLMAGLLFIWGGVVAALYTIGLAHLGSRLSGHELASANAAFVLCYGLGMVLGPQAIGIAMDLFGTNGFSWALALFFGLYILVALSRLVERRG